MQPKLHFHSLDALRFFAFFKVYLLHIPVVASAFPVFSYLKKGGGIGVSFFFVLSGFLISYLLIHEKIQTGKVGMKKFFIRRTLRIWPLYFLVIFSIYFLPFDFKTLFLGYNEVGNGYDLDWRFSFTFLENYKMYIMDMHPKTTTIRMFWSLCIEEHFYIIWCISFFLIPKKRIPLFLIVSIVIAIVARLIEPSIMGVQRIESNEILTNLDYFATGGLLGYFVVKDYQKTSNLIQSIPNWVKVIVITLVVLFVIFQSHVYPYHHPSISNAIRPTFIAIIFTSLLAVFIPKDSSIRFSNKNPLTYLGKISYGLYVYHVFVIVGLNKVFGYLNLEIDNWLNLSLYLLISMGISILISSLSYHYFEQPFLNLREKFTTKTTV
jgi:peptidoglycan/LPS O-acetylase OafA/YrhL